MIDSHSHLDSALFDSDLTEVLARAKQKLKAVITLSDDFKANEKNLKIAEDNKDFVFACFGSGPISLLKEKKLEEVKEFIIKNKDSMAAIGEVGLDYYWDKQNNDNQKQNFAEFIELANELNKPIVVHSRGAEEDALEMLERGAATTVIMHSFEEDKDLIKRALDNGYFIGVTTKAVYSKKTKDLIKKIELTKMLTETDSPFLNPLAPRERNEPANVSLLIELIAKELEVNKKEVDKQTEKNAVKAFDLRIRKKGVFKNVRFGKEKK